MTQNPKQHAKHAYNGHMGHLVWLFVSCLTWPVCAQQAAINTQLRPLVITLLDQARVDQKTVYLGDVADITGSQAKPLNKLKVGQFNKKQQKIVITLQSISQLLSKQSLSRTALTLRGHGRCTVTQQTKTGMLRKTIRAKLSPLIANSQNAVDVDSALTLEDRLVDALEQYATGTPGTLVIQLNDRDRKLLAVAAEQGQYRFEPTQGNNIWGRLTVNIYQYQDGKQVKAMAVRVLAKRRMLAVVAAVAIRHGQILTRQNIAIKEILIDRDRGSVVQSLKEALGKQARSRLVAGEVLLAHKLKKPLLVRKGQVIAVRYISGGLVIKTAGRAMEDGVMGDVIAVRNTRPHLLEKGLRVGKIGSVYDAQVSGDRQVNVNFSDPPQTRILPVVQPSVPPTRLIPIQAAMKG